MVIWSKEYCPSSKHMADYASWFRRSLYLRQSSHTSEKCEPVQCPNSYVKQACCKLDRDRDVSRYAFRTIEYDYFHPLENQIFKNRIDFVTQTRTGKRLIQTVPVKFLDDEVMVARIEAMELKAQQLKIPLTLWTEIELFGDNPEYAESVIRMLC